MIKLRRHVILMILFAILIATCFMGYGFMHFFTQLSFIPLLIYYFLPRKNLAREFIVFVLVYSVVFILTTSWLERYNSTYQLVLSIVLSLVFFVYVLIVNVVSWLKVKFFKEKEWIPNTLLVLLLSLFAWALLMNEVYPLPLSPILPFYNLGILIHAVPVSIFFIVYFSVSLLVSYFITKAKQIGLLSYIPFVLLCVLLLVVPQIDTQNDESHPILSVLLVQTNTFDGWNTRTFQPEVYFNTDYELSSRVLNVLPADMVVWPEYAIPAALDLRPDLIEIIYSIANRTGAVFVVGAKSSITRDGVLLNETNHYVDSVYVLYPNRTYVRYNSSLVPPLNNNTISEFSPLTFEVKGIKFGVLICYEEMSYFRFSQYKNLDVDYFLIVANDQRFGQDLRPFRLTKYASSAQSAIFGIPQVRLANNGYSYVTDKYGKIMYELPVHESGATLVDLQSSE